MRHKFLPALISFGIIFAAPSGLLGATFCVKSASEFQSALFVSAGNGEDDGIKIFQGTYYGTFSFSSIEGHDITILGRHPCAR